MIVLLSLFAYLFSVSLNYYLVFRRVRHGRYRTIQDRAKRFHKMRCMYEYHGCTCWWKWRTRKCCALCVLYKMQKRTQTAKRRFSSAFCQLCYLRISSCNGNETGWKKSHDMSSVFQVRITTYCIIILERNNPLKLAVLCSDSPETTHAE